VVVGLDLKAGPPLPASVDLNLLGINDFHGRIDSNTVLFAGTVEKLRAAAAPGATAFISAGDNIGASLFASSVAKDQPTIDVLNALEMQASAVGNHEFDGGWQDLRDRVIADGTNAKFSYLGANVYQKGTKTPVLPEYKVLDMNGMRVAVIGTVTQEVPSLVTPAGITDLEFGDPVGHQPGCGQAQSRKPGRSDDRREPRRSSVRHPGGCDAGTGGVGRRAVREASAGNHP
jgi:5'-nucleotidase